MTSPEYQQPPLSLTDPEWEYIARSMPRFDELAVGPIYTHENDTSIYGLYVNPMELADGSMMTLLNVYWFDRVSGEVRGYCLDPILREMEVFQLPYEKLLKDDGLTALMDDVQFQRTVGQSTPDESGIAQLQTLIRELREQDDMFAAMMGEQ